MDTNTKEPEIESQVDKENQNDSDKNSRQALPVYTLSESLLFCSKIYTELGVGAFHNKDLISKIHNVAYTSIKQKFSTAQYYGLLELKHNVGYKLTQLFLKIYKPEHDNEKLEGIIESLRQPSIYSKLLDEFNGHTLPSEQGLTARLLRTFGIKEYAALKAAQVFLSNLRNNGLLDGNGNLKISGEKANDTKRKENEEKKDPPNNKERESKNEPLAPGYIEIPVPLIGGKRAYIRIPEDYTPQDCERIAKFVDALK